MNTARTRLSRRRLLQGLGSAALGLPMLRSIPSAAADSGFPTRLVVLFTPNEWIDRSHWDFYAPGQSGPLPAAMPDYLGGLDDFRSKLCLVGDLYLRSRDQQYETHIGGHIGTGHILTGTPVIPYGAAENEFYAGGISVDQFIAQSLGVEALTLAVEPGAKNGHGRISYSGPNAPVDPITAPLAAFDHVFGDFTAPPEIVDAQREQRRSVLDAIAGNITRVQADLPTEDRHKLESHLDYIRELELSLSAPLSLSCEGVPPPPNVDPSYGNGGIANIPKTHRLHMDVLVQALACGTTEVASLQFGGAASQYITPNWANDPINPLQIPRDLHNISHDHNTNPGDATFYDRRRQVEDFFVGQFRYLLEQMDAIPEGDGTLLDHSLVVWCKELGTRHDRDDLLFILAGGAGGHLQTDRFLSLPDVAHNDLLVSLCHLMGLQEVDTFGLPELCNGPLPL